MIEQLRVFFTISNLSLTDFIDVGGLVVGAVAPLGLLLLLAYTCCWCCGSTCAHLHHSRTILDLLYECLR